MMCLYIFNACNGRLAENRRDDPGSPPPASVSDAVIQSMYAQMLQALISRGNPYADMLGEGQKSGDPPCDDSTGRDSMSRACGGRAAEVIPGGRLGGNGSYVDPEGHQRLRGACNDPLDIASLC